MRASNSLRRRMVAAEDWELFEDSLSSSSSVVAAIRRRCKARTVNPRSVAVVELFEYLPQELLESARCVGLEALGAILRDEHGLSLCVGLDGYLEAHVAWWEQPQAYRTLLPVVADFHQLPPTLREVLHSRLGPRVRIVYEWPRRGRDRAQWIVVEASTDAVLSLGLVYETPGTPLLVADRAGTCWLLPSLGEELGVVLSDAPLDPRSERMVTPWEVPLACLELPDASIAVQPDPRAWFRFDSSPRVHRYDDGSRYCLAAAFDTLRCSLHEMYVRERFEGMEPRAPRLEDRVYCALRALAQSKDNVEFDCTPPGSLRASARRKHPREVVLAALDGWYAYHYDGCLSGPEDADNQLAALAEQWHREISRQR